MIHIGSREGNRSYCNLDNGYPYGSSADNKDHAYDNSVTNNTFQVDSTGVKSEDFIKVSSYSLRTTVTGNKVEVIK